MKSLNSKKSFMTKRPEVLLGHILEAIQNIEAFTAGMTEQEFFADRKTRDAVIRNFEIIGEAIKHLPTKLKDEHRGIPWKSIMGMRDIIAHEYFNVDLVVIWDATTQDLPS